MPEQKLLRVLFLHATRHRANEYKVHKLLAESVDPGLVDCFFIWQTHVKDSSKNVRPNLPKPNRVFHWDFGRDMSLVPKPPKWRRALMVFWRFPRGLYFVGRKIREIRPDVIYTSQQSYETVFGAILSFLFSVPHLIHISYPVGKWLGRFSFRTLFHTPHLIACSEFVRKTALDAGIAPEKIETLLHGANVKHYDIPGDPEWLRQEFEIPLDVPVIVTAARLDPGKGYNDLLDAFALVHKRWPEVRLIVCGVEASGTGYSKIIKQKVRDLELGEVVVFAGYRSDLPKIFAGADIFCLPTRKDALPLVFLGAMASGLPVVAVRSGGVPEMVIDGVTGLLSEPGDAEGMAQNLVALLEDKDLAKQLGENGRTRAFHTFSPRKIAQEWAELLKRRLT